MSHKIGVVGDRDSILGFKMLGFNVHFANEASEARNIVDNLANDNYGIIYLTEELAEKIPDTVKRYDAKVTPAIILIPNHAGSKGIGLQRVQNNVEKAVGQNIL